MSAPLPITTPAPGLYPDMPAEVYHSIQAMSAGGLKRMRKSPAHFYGLQIDPSRPPSGPPTPAMQNGTLVHCALFEPAEVEKRYAVRPDGLDARTAAGKLWMNDARRFGRDVIDGAQLAAALAQAAAVRKLPEVAALLADGHGESSAFWTDEATGELCKCRPDWVSPAGDGVVLVDGKTCASASPDGFAKAVANFSYDLQAAHYIEGYEQTTGQRVHGFVFACVENTWPHAAAAYMIPDDWLDVARQERRALINQYAECRRADSWPGYGSSIQLLEKPRWA